MTEVCTISSPAPEFGTGLRRATSQTSFLHQSSYSRSPTHTRASPYSNLPYDIRVPPSVPSSAPSSPRLHHPDFSNQPSYTSTPSSSLSLNETCEVEDDDILFPSYGETPSRAGDGRSEPPSSPELFATDDSTIEGEIPYRAPPVLSNLDAADTPQTAGDDTAIRVEPTRHVDYLSHEWKEEDIWSSWRHIVAKRNVYANSIRLENASWRTWAKTKNRLKTISPESLNWMKDHDVTWLYGPLQTGNTMSSFGDSAPPASHLSRTNSFATKKPILKKRSLSELMLQRSISSSTLMKQAIDSLRAQQPGKPTNVRMKLGARAYSDFANVSSPRSPTVSESPSALASSSSSGVQTPGGDRRHIHFNDKVEQCIAINKELDDHDDTYSAIHDDDDSSDDGIIMMKPVHGKERKLSGRNTPRASFSSESKTIAMLPSTTLKYRGDTPEPPEEPPHRTSFWNAAAKLVSSPSTETLRPSKPSANFLLDDEDEEADMDWQPMSPTARRDSIFVHQARMSGSSSTEEDEDIRARGMRRTPSGMFMPYEEDEDEDDIVATSLFGKVVDTVNTAKDIFHVVWNVGWRQ